MRMGHLQNIQSFETCIETGNLQRYDEQRIHEYVFIENHIVFSKKARIVSFASTLRFRIVLISFLRLIHVQPSTDKNTTSDQWSYLHKNIMFLVNVLILRHLLFRLIQKYLSPVGNQPSFKLHELVFLGCHS